MREEKRNETRQGGTVVPPVVDNASGHEHEVLCQSPHQRRLGLRNNICSLNRDTIESTTASVRSEGEGEGVCGDGVCVEGVRVRVHQRE